VAAAFVLLAPGFAIHAQAASDSPSAGNVTGIWGGERTFGPTVRGTLSIAHEGSVWFAEISGYRAPVLVEGRSLSFTLPGDLGRFRGRLGAKNTTIDGEWIQPGATSMFGQRFSTPVHLVRTGSSLWRGAVRPLRDRVRIYLSVEPPKNGASRAFLRNPEVNFGRFFDLTDVHLEGNTVDIRGTLAWQKDHDPETLLAGAARNDFSVLSVVLDDLGGTYDLRRLEPDTVSDFFPGAPAQSALRYHPPLPRDDGWEVASLESVGMTVAPIEALVRKIVSTPMDSIDAPWIDAVLIARNGKLVFEEYFHGHGPERTHDVRSASKSLTATLVGAEIHAGRLSLGSRVYEVMHGGTLPDDLDPRAARMTIEDLITMSSGLACDDWDSDSPGGEDRMQSQKEQPDWYRYVLDLPMIHEPGEHAAYCSGGMSLAGGVAARAEGLPLDELFDRDLARPLDLGVYHTNLMPNGEAYAGGGLRITARDFLKFGQLMLDDGVWRGRRILDAGWAAAAATPRHEMGTKRREGYGYGWWIFDYALDAGTWKAFYAGGNGGNYIIVVPKLDLAIVFLASNYNQAVQHETKYDDVPKYILRSVVDGERQALHPERRLRPGTSER